MAEVLSLLSLPALLFLGARTTYTDLKVSKIYNRDILRALIAGLALQAVSIVLTLVFFPPAAPVPAAPVPVGVFFPAKMLLNVGISFLTGFLLWMLKWWAAGDAKLILAFAVCMPFRYYLANGAKWFPFFDCFVNTYILALAYILVEMGVTFFRSLGKPRPASPLAAPPTTTAKKIMRVVKMVMNMLFMILIINKLRELVTNVIADFSRFDMFYVYAVMFAFFNQISRFLEKNVVFIVSIAATAAYVAYNLIIGNLSFLNDLASFVSIGFGISAVSMVLTFYLEKTDQKSVPLADLKPRMIPTHRSLKALEQIAAIRRDVKAITFDGLSGEEVALIQKNYPLPAIDVENTFPFAPFLFAGAAVTLVLNDNIFNLVKNLIGGVRPF